ncbi:hypothetical protein [Rhodocyclus tenuis]|uniref:Uncharacterized protein n=1 Tax=Rhodocyclus tenuis TaxID=1066 RepID=A0A840G5H5_RHOTE|nr:hypothetical protein [Rhodocyclus tenuis]MBB4246240.1 hypothetical protein [Rhodocyclus tenuis]
MTMKWEDFAAFGDVFEIEDLCDKLGELAATDPKIRDPAERLTGEKSYLYERIKIQAEASEAILEKEKPGLFRRTYLHDDLWRLSVLLYEVTEKPYRLAEVLPDIRELLLKALIAAHEVFDPHHRAALVAKAEEAGRSSGVEAQRAAQSQQAKDAVSKRADQLRKSAFMTWAKAALDAGATARTVEELQGLKDFDPSWSNSSLQTLKKWSREAGFQFKRGRPSKKN